MHPHTRAMIAAAAFAFVTRKKVAGMYDHAARRDLRISAEVRGDRLQGFDGDRAVRFGGAIPELYDAGDTTFVTCEIDGTMVRGYDRGSATFYTAQVTGGLVQLFDHGTGEWFSYDMQDAEATASYYRQLTP